MPEDQHGEEGGEVHMEGAPSAAPAQALSPAGHSASGFSSVLHTALKMSPSACSQLGHLEGEAVSSANSFLSSQSPRLVLLQRTAYRLCFAAAFFWDLAVASP